MQAFVIFALILTFGYMVYFAVMINAGSSWQEE